MSTTRSTKEELQARIAELEAAQARAGRLHQLGLDLNAASDEAALLQVLVRPAMEAGPFQANLLYIDLNEAGEPEWIEIVAVWTQKDTPAWPVGTRFYIPEFPFARLWLANRNEPALIADVATDERVDENTRNAMAQGGTRAMVIIPLSQAEHWVGLVVYSWDEPHEFSQQETEIYTALVGLVSAILESRRLMGNLERMVAAHTAALRDSERLLQGVINNSPTVIYVKDTEGCYLLINRRYEILFHITLDEILGKTDHDIFPTEVADALRENDLNVLKADAPVESEEVVPHEDGLHTYASLKFPLYDADGDSYAVCGISTDVTGRKQVEADRERLQQELVEAQEQTLRELSTPVIPIMERILVMPLVGSIDSSRATDVMRTLLAGIREHRAKVVILDITGVPIVDSGVATHLDKTIQAARLKGAHTILTGITDAVAETIVDLGIDWSGISTLNDLQTGLLYAMKSLGLDLTPSRSGE